MGVLVVLEMDGSTEAVLAAAVALEARLRRPPSWRKSSRRPRAVLSWLLSGNLPKRETLTSQSRSTARRCRRAACSTR